MFRPIRLVPANTKIDFVSRRMIAYILSGVLIVGSLVMLGVQGLNFGIDFRGGSLIEVQTDGPADLAEMRATLGALNLGEVVLQEFGAENEVLIRIQRQEGPEEEQIAAIAVVQEALGDTVEYRRSEFVGPTVGQELIQAGTLAVVLAIAAILVYIWARFEWQFGICAVAALVHDVVSTIGLFALIQHEFNLATVAALLTIAGYSINDTVVVFDRVRENLRRYKRASMIEILNRSLNEDPLAHHHDQPDDASGLVRAVLLRRRGDPGFLLRADLGRADRHLFLDLHRRAPAAVFEPSSTAGRRGRGPGGGIGQSGRIGGPWRSPPSRPPAAR